MKKSKSDIKNYNEHFCHDILVRIFMALNVANLAVVSMVCKSWQRASRDPILWYKVDLRGMHTYSLNIPKTLCAWSNKHSRVKMNQFLKYALDLSNGHTKCLIFNFYIYLRDVHLISAAKRTPNLKRLVLPYNGHVSKLGIDLAMMSWTYLESITITSITGQQHIFSAIGRHCKYISEIKFTCNFEEYHADALITNTPRLKIISIRTKSVNVNALIRILQFLKDLEVINICHSIIWDKPAGSHLDLYNIRDLEKVLDISLLRKLLFCQSNRCRYCKNISNNNGSKGLYGVLEDIWCQDDILPLAH
ncbi:hypothetical protein RIF29_30141 [Crotalaria pallida]|uniref:F-box domain-containing protein n=1 Tax=Crotalaria pallida TaxID=3830 RepID=A0AAN9EHX4_CROPI